MAQLLVRNIDDEVKARLKRRATRHGISMEEEARSILRNALRSDDARVGGLGTEISSMFREVGLTKAIEEFRGHELKPVLFDE